jgi:hypothetical protein
MRAYPAEFDFSLVEKLAQEGRQIFTMSAASCVVSSAWIGIGQCESASVRQRPESSLFLLLDGRAGEAGAALCRAGVNR